MTPSPQDIPAQHFPSSINSAQSLEASGSQAQLQHVQTLSLAGMTPNTLDAFDHTNESGASLAMLAIHLSDGGDLSFHV